MSSTYTLLDKDAREAVLRGAEALYEAVKVTMGPRGRNVAIERPYGMLPIVTHDGVTVAQYVDPHPHKEQTRGWHIGVNLIRQAADKMNKSAGDGTTTVTVLTYHILNEANKLIEQGVNPMVLKREVEALAEPLVKMIDELKEDVTSEERLAEVATISCADPELGKLIASLVWQVGKDGTVTVEEGQTFGIESEIVEGYTFERGYISPLMITDTKKNEARITDSPHPFIYLTEKALTTADDVYKVINLLPANNRRLLIVCDDIKKDALAYLTNLKTQGAVEVIAVKAPGFGQDRTERLADLFCLTGATVFLKGSDGPFKLTDLGGIKSVLVTRDTTTIVSRNEFPEVTAKRIAEIRAQADNTTVELEKKILLERAAALEGKVAVIKVGGLTDAEVEEKKYRVDDAVAAARAALNDGIVAGGGTTCWDLSVGLEDGTKGVQVMALALAQPFIQLMKNAGYSDDDIEHMLVMAGKGKGYDVMYDGTKLIDLKKAGIIDPAQVTKQAVQTAISVACTLMTMGALILNDPEKPVNQDDLY